jgi:hypothetical protein
VIEHFPTLRCGYDMRRNVSARVICVKPGERVWK